MSKSVCIGLIDSGNIGRRHFQSSCEIDITAEIYVVDHNPEAFAKDNMRIEKYKLDYMIQVL